MTRRMFLSTVFTLMFSSFVLGCGAVTFLAQKYPPKWCQATPVSIELPATFNIATKVI